MSNNNNRIRLAGVWSHQMDDGTPYLKGKINDFLTICVFKRDKENDNSPDYDIVLTQKGGK